MDCVRTRFGDEHPAVRRLHLHALPYTDEPTRLGGQIRGVNRCTHEAGQAHYERKACGERQQARSKQHKVSPSGLLNVSRKSTVLDGRGRTITPQGILINAWL
jgi:hypothetical protein